VLDWLTFKAPLRAARDSFITGGTVACCGPDGELEWRKLRDLPVEGSYSSTLRVRTSGDFLCVSGNPVKFFQGHNLWGTDDLRGLLSATCEAVCRRVELPVTSEDRLAWRNGWSLLSRVDCTAMYEFPSRSDVLAVTRAAGVSARTRHGRATVRGETVYWGQHSRRWSLKAYSKGQELGAGKNHKLPDELPERERLEEYADRMLRVELTLRSLELKDRRLELAAAWGGDTPMEQLAIAMEALQVSERFELPSEVLERLPGKLVSVYRSWQAGDDVRAMYAKNTFYRYRKALLDEAGIDISIVQPAEEDVPANVVPFSRVVEVTLAQVPEWARGTSLYFEPERELA
jgi:II/X family phage/plasmid replication protein